MSEFVTSVPRVLRIQQGFPDWKNPDLPCELDLGELPNFWQGQGIGQREVFVLFFEPDGLTGIVAQVRE